jgi:RHS repeat-associated protein
MGGQHAGPNSLRSTCLGKTYSNGDHAVSYTYDQSMCLGQPTCFNIGRQTSMSDAAGSENWAYDTMGRDIADQRTTNSITKTTFYRRNYDSSVSQLTYPSGTLVIYAYDGAARPISATDQNNTSFVSSAAYAPQGALTSLVTGTNIVSTTYYNSRLQPCRMSVKTSGSTPAQCSDTTNIGNVLDYTYNYSLGTADNGNVVGITNNRDNTRSQVFAYDSLDRIATAQTTSQGGTNCWDNAYGFDAWGNLLSIGRLSGSWSCTNLEGLSVTMNANNQNSLDTYDLAGNLTLVPGTGGTSYTYNSENQLTGTSAGVNYTYDGDGKRVQKSSGTLYWYGTGDEALVETSFSGAMTNEYIFFGGRRIARRDSSGNIFYYFSDHLGTSRAILQSGQTSICYDADFYPFGGERLITNNCPQNYKFTGKERDIESGLDNFLVRYIGSNSGRFLSADPENVGASQDDPQSWNGYAYARNNPLVYTDPDGESYHICVDAAAGGTGKSYCVDIGDEEFKRLQKDPGAGISLHGFTDVGTWTYTDQNGNIVVGGTYVQTDHDLPQDVSDSMHHAMDRASVGVKWALIATSPNFAMMGIAPGLATAADLISVPIINVGTATLPLIPIIPSALEKLEEMGISEEAAYEIIENPSTWKVLDKFNDDNINFISEQGGKLVRITTSPDGTRIISAGYMQMRNLVNGFQSGRFVLIR